MQITLTQKCVISMPEIMNALFDWKKLVHEAWLQGDQIGRIFAYWGIVLFLLCVKKIKHLIFLKYTE
jgi:hypothetical protein